MLPLRLSTGAVDARLRTPPPVASNVPVLVIEVPLPPIARVLPDEFALIVPTLSKDKSGYTALAFDPISPDPEMVLWFVRTHEAALLVPICPVLPLVDVMTSEPGPDNVVLPVSSICPPSARVVAALV